MVTSTAVILVWMTAHAVGQSEPTLNPRKNMSIYDYQVNRDGSHTRMSFPGHVKTPYDEEERALDTTFVPANPKKEETMSGGSMDYFCYKVKDVALELRDTETHPLRKAFQAHLLLIVEALKDIELVDSRDWGAGDEDAAILKVFAHKPGV